MPSLGSIASKIGDGVVESASGKTGGGVMGGSSSSSYGNDFDIDIKINKNTIKTNNTIITGVMIDSGMPPEAGICEICVEICGYSFKGKDEIKIDSEFAQIKVGQPLEIQVANSIKSGTRKTTVFTGFVERIECEIDNYSHIRFILHGMDAKMWMMANKLTEARGTGKSLEQIVKLVISNYSSQAPIKDISLLKNVDFKNTFYQVNQSDYEFLCMLADLTGSLFYIDAEGKTNFCAPSKLGHPSNKVQFKDEIVEDIRFSASVWGTPQSVKVTTIDPKDPSKTISAEASSAASIGSGKASRQVVSQNYSSQSSGTRYVNITDNSIDSQDQAKARADAEYNQRNLKFVETELRTKGNPALAAGQGMKISGFNEPFDNDYLIVRVKHLWGTFSDHGMYSTISYLVANKFTPQGR